MGPGVLCRVEGVGCPGVEAACCPGLAESRAPCLEAAALLGNSVRKHLNNLYGYKKIAFP